MGLQKELPSEIGLLSNLKVLSLGNNELSGEFISCSFTATERTLSNLTMDVQY